MKNRRVVIIVEEEGSEGKPRLRAYGRRAIGKLTGLSEWQVLQAEKRGEFNPESLKSTIAWISSHQTPEPPPPSSPPPL